MASSQSSGITSADTSTTPPVYANKRRSTRVWHQTSVVVRITVPGSGQIEEKGQTFTVNIHGGLMQLNVELQAGQVIVLMNPTTKLEARCHVVRVEPTPEGVFKTAFAFEQPAPYFWRIAHPPDDWGIKKT